MHCLNNTSSEALAELLGRYHLHLCQVSSQEDIPHSFWGAPEAGRLNSTLYVRADTPVHSILHESAHYICMPKTQRTLAQTDAKGSALVENACCYLQIVLTDYILGLNRHILMYDMDCWGYSFRLGSTARWFYADSDDAIQWLIEQQILTPSIQPTWKLR